MVKKIIKKIINYFKLDIVRYNSSVIDNSNKKTLQIKHIFKHFLEIYLSKMNSDNFFFVEIGSNDGKTNDPIFDLVLKNQLKGILIEPQKDVYERLKKNYTYNKNLQFSNYAISNKSGIQKFYTMKNIPSTEGISSYDLESFYMTAISSFDKKTFHKTIKSRIPKNSNPEDYTKEININTLSFNDLVQKYNISKIDLLQIDAEGYDFELIKEFPFDKFSPSLINYESRHLSSEDSKSCESLLKSKGYNLFVHGSDTCAYKV